MDDQRVSGFVLAAAEGGAPGAAEDLPLWRAEGGRSVDGEGPRELCPRLLLRLRLASALHEGHKASIKLCGSTKDGHNVIKLGFICVKTLSFSLYVMTLRSPNESHLCCVCVEPDTGGISLPQISSHVNVRENTSIQTCPSSFRGLSSRETSCQ